MSSNTKVRMAVWLALVLVIGSGVLAGCGSSAPADLEEGPGMLYFYAEW